MTPCIEKYLHSAVDRAAMAEMGNRRGENWYIASLGPDWRRFRGRVEMIVDSNFRCDLNCSTDVLDLHQNYFDSILESSNGAVYARFGAGGVLSADSGRKCLEYRISAF